MRAWRGWRRRKSHQTKASMASWKEGDVLAVIHEAMVDDRVQRTMAVAMRDVWMRKRFATLRAAPTSMTMS